MLIEEMKELPQKAGITELVWFNGGPVVSPCRKDNQIFLPLSPGSYFWFLKDGNQFLYKMKDDRVFFGGTDEQACFVVELKVQSINHYSADGEEGFYRALKPKEIKSLELKLKTAIPMRQGDWWAIKLPHTWEDLKGIYEMLTSWEFQIWKTSERFEFGDFWKHGSLRLNLTRHVVRGMMAEVNTMKNRCRSCFIVEGVVEAPDHRPLQLIGPHALFQSELLVNPTTSD